MRPLNLDLLRAGDDAEWQRAWDDYGLWNLAYAVVRSFFIDEGKNRDRRQFIEDVALEAVAELVEAVTEGRVNNVAGLKGMLRTIARHKAIDRIRERWFNAERPQPRRNDHEDHREQDGPEAFMESFELDVGVDGQRHLDAIIEEWAGAAALDILERALLRELIVHRCTIDEFAEAHTLHPSSVFRLKNSVLLKLRRLFRNER